MTMNTIYTGGSATHQEPYWIPLTPVAAGTSPSILAHQKQNIDGHAKDTKSLETNQVITASKTIYKKPG